MAANFRPRLFASVCNSFHLPRWLTHKLAGYRRKCWVYPVLSDDIATLELVKTASSIQLCST